MKKLNKKQKTLINNVRSEIINLNYLIDEKYAQLVESLVEDLSEDMESHLFDYVYNPIWSQDLNDEYLFEKEPLHYPQVGDKYQIVDCNSSFNRTIFMVCLQLTETGSLYCLQSLKDGTPWNYLVEDIRDVFGNSSNKFFKINQ